jgi:hypothetical protein
MAVTYPDQGSLLLHTSIQYGEPMSSQALNKGFHNIIEHGIYEGFDVTLPGGMDIVIAGTGDKHTAAARHDAFTLTIHAQIPATLTLVAGGSYAVVVDSYYQYGIATKQVDLSSVIEAAEYKVINVASVEDQHIVIVEFVVPGGTTELTQAMISYANRSYGGMSIANHIAQSDPHTQYHTKQRSPCPVGVPLPWPTDTAPTDFAIMKGQAFNPATYPELALAYPSSFLPDMRGLAITGKTDAETLLAYEADGVKSHSHNATLTSTDLGTKTTSSNTHSHDLQVRSNSDGGDTYVEDASAGGTVRTSATGTDTHEHTVDIGSHNHAVSISATGGLLNTIKNRKFNWIVRLA